jgi:pimeloyl-ACP methyl ester carboxylesterase
VFRAGAGDVVVLLHGAVGTWRHWRPVLPALSARFEVVAPTLPGHAGGPPLSLDAPLTIANVADALERELDALGVGTAHLVGNSLGGLLAIELATRGRARSVVALSPAGGWDPGSAQGARIARFFRRSRALSRTLRPRLYPLMRSTHARRLALWEVMYRGQLTSPTDVIDFARAASQCPIFAALVRALPHDEALPANLDQVAAPVLLAWAEHDRVLPARTCAARFRREIPGAEYRVLAGVGHVPMWDDTQLIADTITDWIDRHTPAAATPAADPGPPALA